MRPVLESEAIGEPLKPDLREQEAVLRAQTLGLGIPRFEIGKEMLIAGLKQTYMFVSRSNIPSQWERFVPYIGPMIAAVAPIALAFAVDPGWSMVLATAERLLPTRAEIFSCDKWNSSAKRR